MKTARPGDTAGFAAVPELAPLAVPGAIRAVVQPVVRTADLVVVSHEALSRMTHEPYHPPDRWLSRAEGVGQRTQLERGVRLAIDDIGAGYSSPRHVIELAPDSSNSTGRW